MPWFHLIRLLHKNDSLVQWGGTKMTHLTCQPLTCMYPELGGHPTEIHVCNPFNNSDAQTWHSYRFGQSSEVCWWCFDSSWSLTTQMSGSSESVSEDGLRSGGVSQEGEVTTLVILCVQQQRQKIAVPCFSWIQLHSCHVTALTFLSKRRKKRPELFGLFLFWREVQGGVGERVRG